MKHLILLSGALLALGLFALNPAAHAQTGRPVKVALSGGVILPTGELSESADPGYRLGAGVIVDLASLPVALRAGAAYDRLAHSHEHVDAADDDRFSQVSATLDALYRLPGLVAMPYLLAGAGAFKLTQPEGHGPDDAPTRFGFNLGGGIDFRVGELNAFLEARWQSVTIAGEPARYVPVTFGVRF